MIADLLPGLLAANSAPGAPASAEEEADKASRAALVEQMQQAMGGYSNATLERLMLAG